MIPQVLSLTQRTITGEARAKALGAVLGRPRTGWRPVFLVNVPVGVVLLIIGRRALTRDGATARETARGLDLPGLVLLGAAVSLLTVPLVLGQEEDRPLWSWLSLGGSAVAFALFCAYERGSRGAVAPP